jgi:hypothetical protein
MQHRSSKSMSSSFYSDGLAGVEVHHASQRRAEIAEGTSSSLPGLDWLRGATRRGSQRQTRRGEE